MKRKIVSVSLSLMIVLSLSACGVSQKDYDQIVSEKESVEAELVTTKESSEAELASTKESAKTELTTTKESLDQLQADYDAYKEKMKPYEEMEIAEANAKKAEAEAAEKAQKQQEEATDAVSKVWDFEKGSLAQGATRELHNAATAKVNGISDESVKNSLNEALTAANDVLAQAEQAAAEEAAKKKAAENASMEQKNALSQAKSYLSFTSFSYTGLISQLEFEGYSTADATFGADNCGADWNEQAAKKAKEYLNFTSFSRSGLIDQLKFEGFTSEQAEYGATQAGY